MSLVDVNGDPLKSTAVSMGGEISSWRGMGRMTDELLLPSKMDSDGKASDLIQTHGVAAGAVQTYIDGIVGHQFRLSAKPLYKRLGISAEDAREWATDVEAAFTEYAEDTRCYIDAEERRTFTMLIRDGVRSHFTHGEIFSSAEWIKHQGSLFRTSIKPIASHRICNPDGQMDSESLRGGIELNRHGAAVACHLKSSQYNAFGLSGGGKWRRIKLRKAWGRRQILHIFDPIGDGNTRGSTAFLSILSRLKMLDKYQGVRLQNAVLNAMYAATIETDLDSDTAFSIIGGGEEGQKKMLNWLDMAHTYHSSANITMNGLKIPHLVPGEKLNLNAPANVDNGFAAFEQSLLRNVAAGLSLSYEQLAKDYSKVSYSSARAALMNEWRYFQGRRATIAGRYATEIYSLWLEEAINKNIITLPRKALFNFYEATAAWTRSLWIGAGRLAIDGLKEVKEAVLRIEAGLSTYEKELALLGEDYQEIFEQQVRETKEREAAGLPRPAWAAQIAAAPDHQEQHNANA